jgi:hypothetical protein
VREEVHTELKGRKFSHNAHEEHEGNVIRVGSKREGARNMGKGAKALPGEATLIPFAITPYFPNKNDE